MKLKDLIFWFRSFALEHNTDAQPISEATIQSHSGISLLHRAVRMGTSIGLRVEEGDAASPGE